MMRARVVQLAALWSLGQLPLSASLVGHRSRRQILDDTVVVLRTAGHPTKFVAEDLMQRYHDQLHKYGIRFSVLHHTGNGDVNIGDAKDLLQLAQTSADKDGVVQLNHVSSRTNRTRSSSGVQLCSVSWEESKKEFLHGRDLDESVYTARTCHDQNLALWWKHCAHDLGSNVKHVWFIESDAYFNGNLVNFLKDFADNDADLIASGFRVAGKHWWKLKTGMFDKGLKHGLQMFEKNSKVVSNVNPLPGMIDGPKNCWFSGHNDRQGLLFFQDHVMRLSKDLLQAVSKNMYGHGILGASEAFISTLCASGLDFREDRACTIHDFAPTMERKGGDTWVTPVYCFGEKSHYDPKLRLHCTEKSWHNRWIHAVKAKSPGAMECGGGGDEEEDAGEEEAGADSEEEGGADAEESDDGAGADI